MRPANLLDILEVLAHQSPEQLQGVSWAALASDLSLTEEQLRADFQNYQAEAAKVSLDDDIEAETGEDPYPEFPKLFGPVHSLAELIGPSLAYSHKVLHLLTCIGLHLSGKVSLGTDPWLQPRFYSVMVGPPASTKSAVDHDVRRILFPKGQVFDGELRYRRAPLLQDIAVEYSINSGPALSQAFEESPSGKVLIASDELSSLFEKARSTAASPNSLHGEFLRLYESNEIGRRVVQSRKYDKKTGKTLGELGKFVKIDSAQLAIIAGATEKSFGTIWQGTGGAASGLQSRFSLSYSAQMLPAFQVLTDEQRAADTLEELMTVLAGAADKLVVSEDAQKQVGDWLEAQGTEIPARALDTAKRAAIVLASCDQTSTVSGAVMRWCLAFADYQVAIKGRLMPQDADGPVQAFEQRILSYFVRHKRATLNQVRQSINPARYPGGFSAYERATQGLVRAGALTKDGKTKKNTVIWCLN